MKKSKSKPAKRKAKKATKSDAPTDQGRRNSMRLIRNGAIGAVILGGGGIWGATAVQATIREQDLTRIGNGIPTIVQIHDPQCAQCTSLQRQTRKALKCFDKTQMQYLVASIRTPEGQAFAASHGVPHVTLMFFDAGGQLQDTLQGVHQRDTLKPIFTDHAGLTS